MRRAAIFALVLILAGCSKPKEPLPVLGEVGDFTLTRQDGRDFGSIDLEGKVWVADFIFTNCPGPCPRMTQLMKRLQDQAPGVELVSFTVDPDRDTPEVLAAYASKHGAEQSRWHFLTGSREDLHNLSRHAFKLGSVNRELDHSTRFALVDSNGQIRGYYGTQQDSPINRLLEDLRTLREQPAS